MLSIYLCALIIWYKVIVQPGITSWGHYELQAIGGIKRNVLISVVKKRVKFGIMEIVSVKKSWVRSDCLFPVTMFSVFFSIVISGEKLEWFIIKIILTIVKG